MKSTSCVLQVDVVRLVLQLLLLLLLLLLLDVDADEAPVTS